MLDKVPRINKEYDGYLRDEVIKFGNLFDITSIGIKLLDKEEEVLNSDGISWGRQSLVEEFARMGLYKRAEEIAKIEENNYSDQINILIELYRIALQNNDADIANLYVGRIIELSRTTKISTDVIIADLLSIFVDGLQENNFKKELLEEIESNIIDVDTSIKIRTYISLVENIKEQESVRREYISKVSDLLSDPAITDYDKLYPNTNEYESSVHNSVIDFYFEIGDLYSVELMHEFSLRKVESLSEEEYGDLEYYRNEEREAYVRNFINAGKFELAIDALEKLTPRDRQGAIMNIVDAIAYQKIKNNKVDIDNLLDEALQVFIHKEQDEIYYTRKFRIDRYINACKRLGKDEYLKKITNILMSEDYSSSKKRIENEVERIRVLVKCGSMSDTHEITFFRDKVRVLVKELYESGRPRNYLYTIASSVQNSEFPGIYMTALNEVLVANKKDANIEYSVNREKASFVDSLIDGGRFKMAERFLDTNEVSTKDLFKRLKIKLFTQMGRLNDASQLLKIDDGVPVDNAQYVRLSEKIAQGGDKSGAYALFMQAVSSAKNADAIGLISTTMANVGFVKQAFDLLENGEFNMYEVRDTYISILTKSISKSNFRDVSEGDVLKILDQCITLNDLRCLKGIALYLKEFNLGVNYFADNFKMTDEQKAVFFTYTTDQGDAPSVETNIDAWVRNIVGGDEFNNQQKQNLRNICAIAGVKSSESSSEKAEILGTIAFDYGIKSGVFARLLREAVKVDKKIGTNMVKQFLQRFDAEDQIKAKRVRYLYRLLSENGGMTKNVMQFATFENMSFLRQLLAQSPNQFNTVIDTISKTGIELTVENKSSILSALEDIGSVTPIIFTHYRKLPDDKKKEFAMVIKSLKKSFFRNEKLDASLVDSLGVNVDEGNSLLAEMIYVAYDPVGMSFEEVEGLLVDRLQDRTTDIDRYEFPDDGYAMIIKNSKHELRRGADLDVQSVEALRGLLWAGSMSHTDIKSRSMTMQKVIKSGGISDSEISTLFSEYADTSLQERYKVVNEGNAYNFLQELRSDIEYAKAHFHERLVDDLVNDEKTLDKMRALLMTGKKSEGRIRNLARQAGYSADESDTFVNGTIETKLELVAKVFVIQYMKKYLGMIKKELRKFIQVDAVDDNDFVNTRAYISKNVASFFAKASAGICTANDVSLFERGDHFHINIVEGGEYVRGNIQVYIQDIDGYGPSLILRGFNPNETFLRSGVSPEGFIEEVLRIAKQFANDNSIQSIFVTEQGAWHALSNRGQIAEVFRRKYLREDKRINFQLYVTDTTSVQNLYLMNDV